MVRPAAGVSLRQQSWLCWGACGVKKSKRPWHWATENNIASRLRQHPRAALPACDTLFSLSRRNQRASTRQPAPTSKRLRARM
jgi:hypothetical protein